MFSQCTFCAGTVQTFLSFAGSPLRSHLMKDFSYITVRDDDLAKVRVPGTRQVERRSPIPLTTLSPLGEAPGPPDAVYQVEDDPQMTNPDEIKSDLEKGNLQGTQQVQGRSPIPLTILPPLEESPDLPDAVYQAEDESQQTNPDEIKSDLEKRNLQGARQIQGRSPILLDTPSPMEESPDPPDAVYQAEDESQQTNPDEINSDLEKGNLQGTQQVQGRSPIPLTILPPLEESPDPPDAVYQAEDESQQTNPDEIKSDLEKRNLQGARQIQGRSPILLDTPSPMEESPDPPDAVYQAEDESQQTSPDEINSDLEKGNLQGTRQIQGRSLILLDTPSPMEESPDLPDAVYQAEDESQQTNSDEIKSDLEKGNLQGTRQIQGRSPILLDTPSPMEESPDLPDAVYQAEDESQQTNPDEIKSDLEKGNLQGTRQIQGRSPILLDTPSPMEEFPDLPDAVYQAEDESQQTNPDEIKSDLEKGNLQGTRQIQGRSPILLDTPSPMEESPDLPDAVYQAEDESQQTSPDEIKSDLEKGNLQGTRQIKGRSPILLDTPSPMEESPDLPDAVYQAEDESQQTNPNEIKSDLEKRNLQGTRQIPGRSPILLDTPSPLEESPDPPDSGYQVADDSQQTSPDEIKSDLEKAKPQRTWEVPERPQLEEDINAIDAAGQVEGDEYQGNPEDSKSVLDKMKFRRRGRIPWQLATFLTTQEELQQESNPSQEELPAPPDAVYQTEDESQKATQENIKSDLEKVNLLDTQGRSPILPTILPPVEESDHDPPDAVYQTKDESRKATAEMLGLENVKLQRKLEGPEGNPLEEDIDPSDGAGQVEDEYQATPEEDKSDLAKVKLRIRKQIPLQEKTTDPPDADEYQTIPEKVESEEASDKEQTPSRGNEEEPLPQENLRVSRQQGQFLRRGTSTIPEPNTDVRPEMMSSSGIRWNVAHLQSKDDNKRYKVKKKKKQYSKAEDPAKSGSPLIVAGIAAGILVLLSFVACLVWLW